MILGSIISGITGATAASKQAKSTDRASDIQRQNFLDSKELIEPQIQIGDDAREALAFELGLAERPVFRPEVDENSLGITTIAGAPIFETREVTRGRDGQDTVQEQIQVGTQPDTFSVGNRLFDSRNAAADFVQSQQPSQGFQYQGFQKTPGYDFQLQEGQKAIDRAASASGRLHSGATVKAGQRFAQGLADQSYNNHLNRLASLAGAGQVATGTAVNLGQSNANALSNLQLQKGNAQASSFNAIGGAANNAFDNTIGGLSAFGFL